jgi:hypothetical protein
MFLIVTAVPAADKDKRFTVGPVSSYPGHQQFQNLRVAAVPFLTDEETKAAFGKVNPNKHGVLPVLLVFENATGKALKFDLQVNCLLPDGGQVEATPARDVMFLELPKVQRGPNPAQIGMPIPIPRGMKKSPLNTPEIEGYAFAAKLLPPGESVHGFVYFQIPYRKGLRVVLNGIFEAATGKELFFIEMPLDKPTL